MTANLDRIADIDREAAALIQEAERDARPLPHFKRRVKKDALPRYRQWRRELQRERRKKVPVGRLERAGHRLANLRGAIYHRPLEAAYHLINGAIFAGIVILYLFWFAAALLAAYLAFLLAWELAAGLGLFILLAMPSPYSNAARPRYKRWRRR